jgi:hypothetical protein
MHIIRQVSTLMVVETKSVHCYKKQIPV